MGPSPDGAARAISALNTSCRSLLYQSKPIYPVLVGVGAAVSTAAIGASVLQAARQGTSPENILLTSALICFLVAAAVYGSDMRRRIHDLTADLVNKDGYKH